ncbi:MAG: protoporphyrinogen oxidase [Proteobacteria bacterium]|nr:protoporphyrinogen oxidase [Pseudomonadota bacterium]
MRIAIVGAGLSGLATAFWLQRARPDWPLTIYESAPAPGGALATAEIEGFRFEGGANGFLTNKPDSLELVRAAGAEALLLESSAAARRRYVYTDALHRLPESPGAFLGSPLLSWRGKLRLLAEPWIARGPGDPDETLEDFGRRRLGREFTAVFLDAMTAGIYASTPRDLAVAAAFPLVAALEREHGGLIRGMLARRRRGAGPGGVLTSFTGGVGTFVAHLHRAIAADWRLGSAASAVERAGRRWRVQAAGRSDEFDRLVVATPAYAAAPLLAPVDAALGASLARIRYAPVAVVGLGYRGLAAPLDGFGLLSTSTADLPVLGVLCDSNVFPDRAPPGATLLRAIVGGLRRPELAARPEEELVALTRAAIERALGVRAAPDVVYVRRWPRAIPNYGPGHLATVAAIEAAAAQQPGLALVGNAYRGVAMNDCCREGRALAARLADDAQR